MTIYIKNMVCVRCRMAVKAVLDALRLDYASIELGKVELAAPLTLQQQEGLIAGLNYYELELMEDRKKILVERIKCLIIEFLDSPDTDPQMKLSVHISKALHYNYTYLANMFSEVEGITLERFYIESRIERVKRFIVYEDITLTQIAYQLNYSNVSHLCLQFKKTTGLTPSQFKKQYLADEVVWKPW